MKKNYKASPDPEAVLHNLMQAHHGATAGNPAYEIVRVIGNYLSLLNRQPGFREGELRQMAQAGLDRALDMLRDATTRAVLDSDTHFLKSLAAAVEDPYPDQPKVGNIATGSSDPARWHFLITVTGLTKILGRRPTKKEVRESAEAEFNVKLESKAWQRLFKEMGFDDLPAAKAGRPQSR